MLQVIEYQGNPDVFAWKYPNARLALGTQLIVRESQEALFFKGGIACDVFQAGRHTLSTANIPLLSKLLNLPFGGQSPFIAEVWFVNKTFLLDVKWGTATPIQLQDPKYKLFVPVRAFGQFGVQISNSKKFLIKLVGTLPRFDRETLLKYFRGVCLSKIKDVIASYVARKNVGLLEINAYLDEISGYLQKKLAPVFDEYGIKLTNFCVNDINVPENDPAVVRLKEALAKRAEMDIVGYGYQQERSFNLLEKAASAPGPLQSGLTDAALGLGMGVGVGRQIGALTQNLSLAGPEKQCPNCRSATNADAKFCSYCGFDFSPKPKSVGKAKCPACGATVASNSKFCPECGRAFAIKCANCGKKVASNVKFCPECGASTKKENA